MRHLTGPPDSLAAELSGRRFITAEFMYKPRPEPGRERVVFDYAIESRLAALAAQDAVLFICADTATVESLAVYAARYPTPLMLSTLANPPLAEIQSDTPERLGWSGRWQHHQITDRWARILYALNIVSRLSDPGYLLMPAHDAVWGPGLLAQLVRYSERHSCNGLPAAVSPCTYWQHSAVPGAAIPIPIIDLLNTAFARDSLFGWKVRTDRVQGFWGKMSLLPFGLARPILETAQTNVWEDDLEIDRVIRAAGYGVRATWISAPGRYRQALPVFDQTGVRRVIERTLHYSLNIPGAVGQSALNAKLGPLGALRRWFSPRFAGYNALAETLIAECTAEIRMRLDQFGASWVDWGHYRYVMRVGDPVVEVWKRKQTKR